MKPGSVHLPDLTPEEENERLHAIVTALMSRSERPQDTARPMGQLQDIVTLEQQIRARTRDLAGTLDKLRVAHARLSRAERDAVRARNDLTDALEAMDEGFAIFDANDVLQLTNSRFCAQLPDIRGQIGPGLGFQDYVRIVSQSRFLALGQDETGEDWVNQRLASHAKRNVSFVVPLIDDQFLQVSEQRMSSGGTAVTQTDVTAMVRHEREEREKLLDAQARMLRATLDHIDQGVCIFDSDERLVGWNRRLREIFQPAVGLMVAGTPLQRFLDDLARRQKFGRTDPRTALLAWVRGPQSRGALSLEIIQDTGTVLVLSAQATPDRGFVMSFTDLTAERQAIAEMHRLNESLEARVSSRTRELEAARDAAERANASKSRFVASASHDLLQPLNAAKLFLASLGTTELDETQTRLAERITSAFGSVEQILSALLDISKFDIGAARAQIEPIALGALFARLHEEFAPMAAEKGLQLDVIRTDVFVMSDAVYLKRILQNLISNAIRYTTKGRILVGLRRKGTDVVIEVWDTGPGIPADAQEAIFQEFIRLDPEGPAGMGLGLAIVEQACALLGHPLSLRSQMNRGSVFSVALPRAATPLSTQKADDTEELAGPLDHLLVLVIENDPSVSAAMVSILARWGASPLEAHDLDSATAVITDLGVAPDVILADQNLGPERQGLSIIQSLRARHGRIPALLITADHSPELATKAEIADIGLMLKPVALKRLKRVLQQTGHWSEAKGITEKLDQETPARGDHSYWLRLQTPSR